MTGPTKTRRLWDGSVAFRWDAGLKSERDRSAIWSFATGNQCVITGSCRLPRVLNEAIGAFLGTLDRYTLASISLRARDFREVLAPVTKS